MVRAGLTLAAALLLLLAAMAVKGLPLSLPSPPDAAGAGQFDAHRAAARLRRVLGEERAHPVDSAANDALRERLIAEMRAVGLDPRIRDDFACNSFARARAIGCARVRNLVATIGPAEGRHVLLSVHYDSSAAGPGAGDAGFGIATLLEVAERLRALPNLRRPVTFLFNEGEEPGLIGARAFVQRDPLAARVDTLINLEARGVNGPAVMFETSRPNAAAVALFATAVRRPVANSMTTDLYRLIPNSTDVTVFAERPWTILNFAVIGNETRYHSDGDNLAALDRRSLDHMGEQTLGLTVALAEGAEPDARGERLYMDLLGRQLIVLPLLFGLIVLVLLLLFFLMEARRRGALGRPLAAVAAAIVGSAAVAGAGQVLLGLLRAGDYWRGHPAMTEIAVYASALTACLLALLVVARDAEPARLRAAFWLLFLLGGAAISAIAPGAAIYFLAPPLAAAVGIVAARRWPGAEPVGSVVAILLLYLTFGPSLALFEELMSNGPHWMFAPLGAVLLLPALIELRPLIARVPPILVLAGAGDLFLIPWAAVALTPAYSEDRQQLFTIEYVWDADARQGRWAVNNDGRAVPYDAAWQRVELPYSLRRRWVAPAPAVPVAPPGVELVGTKVVQGGRRLSLRLRSNGAESVSLIAPAAAALRQAGSRAFLQPFAAGGADERYVVRCAGRSCDGAVIDLVVGQAEPVEFTLVGTRAGLPPQAAPLIRARPALARPQYAPDSTIALAKARF